MKSPSRQDVSAVCPYCRGVAPWLLDSADVNRKIDNVVFSYHRCFYCGLVFLRDVPSDLEKYYSGGYQSIPETLAELKRLAAPERYRVEDVTRFKRGGSLLEIGPWIGIFCANALDAGFEVKAIEMNRQCIDLLTNMLRIEAIPSSDPAQTLTDMSECFDAIVLWHSIEHLPRPWDVIRAAAHRLNPGGILLIAAPNPESFEFKRLGEQWFHLDAPRHINLLPPALVEKIGEEAGLTCVGTTTRDRLSDLLSESAWAAYAGSVAASLPPIRYLRGLTRIVLGHVFRAVFFAQQKKPGRGSGYTIILQQPAEQDKSHMIPRHTFSSMAASR
jgi:SAM-dependent methyltransferase